MKVWVLEQGCYEDRYITGVYATAELGMAANPPREGRNRGPASAERSGGWQYHTWGDNDEYGEWDNGLDWDDAMSLTPFDLVESVGG